MLTLHQVKLPVSHSREELEKKIVKTLKISSQELQSWKIRKQSLDARKKPELHFVYTIDASVKKERQVLKKVNNKNVTLTNRKKFSYLTLPEGITENEMAAKLLEFYKAHGGEGYSFDPIVGYGPNGADGHHGCDQTPLKPGDSIVVDMGCMYQGYCSDMTRTFYCKSADPEQTEIHDIVREAVLRAESVIKPGVRFCDIDAQARDYIDEKGYSEYWKIRLGHFIGQEDHEYGDVSPINTNVAEPGMIFSIEPGIYLEGKYGVRIEDLVLVTEDGHELLNAVDKKWRIVG